jgi:hypothetical protein
VSIIHLNTTYSSGRWIFYYTLQRVSTVHLPDNDLSVQPNNVTVYTLDLYVVFVRLINTLLKNTQRHGVTQTVFLVDSSMWSLVRKHREFHFGSYTLAGGGSEQDSDDPLFTKRNFNSLSCWQRGILSGILRGILRLVWIHYAANSTLKMWAYICPKRPQNRHQSVVSISTFCHVDILGGSGPLTGLLHLWNILEFFSPT